jgi:tungstate transport system permease protein
MGQLIDAIFEAFGLLFGGDPAVYGMIGTSFRVALTSTSIAAIIAFPMGIWFGLSEFRGRRVLDIVLNTLLFLPTVVVGHLVYMVLTRQGPLGEYHLLFTPTAIVIGQVILATPIITTMVSNAIRVADPRIISTAVALGIGRFRSYLVLLGEIRELVLLSVVAAFGRVVAEVGVSMMLGGNIFGKTRTITTGIALLTSQGEFGRATALGMVLLILVLIINILVYQVTHRLRS